LRLTTPPGGNDISARSQTAGDVDGRRGGRNEFLLTSEAVNGNNGNRVWQDAGVATGDGWRGGWGEGSAFPLVRLPRTVASKLAIGGVQCYGVC
jgi:hypothetical protein